MMDCFQTLVSNSTCAATPWEIERPTIAYPAGPPNRPFSVYRLGEMPIQSCGQSISAPRGKASARLTAHTELREMRQRSASTGLRPLCLEKQSIRRCKWPASYGARTEIWYRQRHLVTSSTGFGRVKVVSTLGNGRPERHFLRHRA